MQIEITRKFQKQVSNWKNNKTKAEIKSVIEKIIQANSISEIRNIKKLKGHKNIFRIRIGDYRIGIAVRTNLVIFAAFDHRSDIYKYFP